MSAAWHPAWELLANQHRPSDPVAIASEIRRLHASGLTPRDVSVALRIDMGAVLEALRAAA